MTLLQRHLTTPLFLWVRLKIRSQLREKQSFVAASHYHQNIRCLFSLSAKNVNVMYLENDAYQPV